MHQTRVAIGSERLFAKSKWQTREDVNAKLLPALIPHGVVSVTAGRTLEQAYFRR